MRARGLAGVFMPSGTGERTFLRIQAESPVDFQVSSAGLRNRYRRLRNERTLGNLACRTSTCSVGKPGGLSRDAESAFDNVEALSLQSVELAVSVPDGHMLRRLPRDIHYYTQKSSSGSQA